MINYYKYNFVSPYKLYARVQEELRSYFATGAVDTVLFPVWTEEAIKNFRNTFLPIKETVLCVKNGKADLPEDFKKIRAAWATSSHFSNPFINSGSLYYQKNFETIVLSDGPVEDFSVSADVHTHTVIHKQTKAQIYGYNITALLEEGWVPTPGYGACNTYQIEGDCLIASFNEGVISAQYYSDGVEDDGYQLIPDDSFVQDYIRKFITHKIHKIIWNQTTDESFNQSYQKMKEAESEMYDAFVKADTEAKKDTLADKKRKALRTRRRNDKYRL